MTHLPTDRAGGSAESRSAARSSSGGWLTSWTVLARQAAYPTPTTSWTRQATDQLANNVLPGFSKWVYDLTGYYEKNGFQARASWRHRSKYEGEVIALFQNLQPTLTQPDEQVDAQIGYTFQPGSRFERAWHSAPGQQRAEFALSNLRSDRSDRDDPDAGEGREIRTIVAARRELPLPVGGFEMKALAGRSRPRVILCLAAALLASAAAAAETWPRAANPAPRDAALEARVHAIVAGMTLEQKIGQMTQPDIRSVTPDDVRRYYIGSILNGGGAWPSMNMHASVDDWLKLSDAFYRASHVDRHEGEGPGDLGHRRRPRA